MNILKKIRFTSPLSNFDQEFNKGVLASEQKRATILAIIILCVLFSQLAGSKTVAGGLINDRFTSAIFNALILAAFIYELLVQFIFGRFRKNNLQPPIIARYINALVETSIPTIGILIFATNSKLDPFMSMNAPPSSLYFIFIILSALRLNFYLCIFTGCIAAVEYCMIYLYFFNEIQTLSYHEPIFNIFQAINIAILLGSGVIAGFVSSQIRQNFQNLLKKIEDRQKVLDVFGQHVSPEVVEQLLSQKVEMPSCVQPVCVMFLDIRGFTTFSENKNPEKVVNYLNELFHFMVNSINHHKGIINKFLGDGFMAVFGAPISEGNICLNAVNASQEIIAQLDHLNLSGEIPPTRIGIGLNAGDAVTGNVGSQQRKEYTIIGDVVNLAARIEPLNKKYNSQLLISEAVWRQLNTIDYPEAKEIDTIQVRGRNQPVKIYKLA